MLFFNSALVESTLDLAKFAVGYHSNDRLIKSYALEFFTTHFESLLNDKFSDDDTLDVEWVWESNPELKQYVQSVQVAFMRQVNRKVSQLSQDATIQNHLVDEILAKALAESALTCLAVSDKSSMKDKVKSTLIEKIYSQHKHLLGDKLHKKVTRLFPLHDKCIDMLCRYKDGERSGEAEYTEARQAYSNIDNCEGIIRDIFDTKENLGLNISLLERFPDDMLKFLFASACYENQDICQIDGEVYWFEEKIEDDKLQEIACTAVDILCQDKPDFFKRYKDIVVSILNSPECETHGISWQEKIALRMFFNKFIGKLRQESEVAIAQQLRAGPR